MIRASSRTFGGPNAGRRRPWSILRGPLLPSSRERNSIGERMRPPVLMYADGQLAARGFEVEIGADPRVPRPREDPPDHRRWPSLPEQDVSLEGDRARPQLEAAALDPPGLPGVGRAEGTRSGSVARDAVSMEYL